MTVNQRPHSGGKDKHLLSPVEGGIVDKIQPLLRYAKPLPPPGSLAEVFLILKNNTDRRVEGWLTITPPRGWMIAPGKRLMIAIREQGTIVAEFYLSIPASPALGSHFLRIKVTTEETLLAEAAFDLRVGLLFLVDG